MKKLKILTTALLASASLNATTIYYNGEGNDIGAWSILRGSHESASLIEVHDDTLNSTVMQFSDGGLYSLRMPNGFWNNETEHVLSFDMRLTAYYTIYVYVDTLEGVRKLFYNAINVNVGHHNTGILNGIGNGRTHMFEHRNWQINRGQDIQNNQNGWVRATLDLDRDLRDTEPNNRVLRVLSIRFAGTGGRVDNVTLDNPTRTTRAADAADWRITTGIPAGGTIENHQENADRGNVVSFSGTDASNSYSTGAITSDGAGSWNDTQNDIIQWKMRTEDNFNVIIHTTTANGDRDLIYSTDRSDSGFDNANGEIGIGLGWSRDGDGAPYGQGTDNRWQTYTRNIATDIAEFENGNSLISINGMRVIGTDGRKTNDPMVGSDILIDDIQLFSSVVPTPPVLHEEATELNRWRLRDNSVRISFRDNAEGETGFRYINTDTNTQLGTDLAASNGTGNQNIAQINGLTAGTTYNVTVHTLFNDGRATAISEPITFTTTGNAPEGGAEAASELNRWRLRADSVRVSFRDNAEGETGFRFINDATGVQLGTDLPATDGTGTSSIGQINGLTANTAYTVRVHTLFADGRATAISGPLTFTTLEDPNAGDEAADDLARWRLRTNSVRVSFRDNAEGETGFRLINDATGLQMGTERPATDGTGTYSIVQVNGLTANTDYTVRVHTLFDDGRATAVSEP
ncbi:MAG TPA: hypothetical protein EYM49_05295, partial [Campylobacterales bacterium]|nr:hypothetical protein [Campylobacterales bacterium]